MLSSTSLTRLPLPAYHFRPTLLNSALKKACSKPLYMVSGISMSWFLCRRCRAVAATRCRISLPTLPRRSVRSAGRLSTNTHTSRTANTAMPMYTPTMVHTCDVMSHGPFDSTDHFWAMAICYPSTFKCPFMIVPMYIHI